MSTKTRCSNKNCIKNGFPITNARTLSFCHDDNCGKLPPSADIHIFLCDTRKTIIFYQRIYEYL